MMRICRPTIFPLRGRILRRPAAPRWPVRGTHGASGSKEMSALDRRVTRPSVLYRRLVDPMIRFPETAVGPLTMVDADQPPID